MNRSGFSSVAFLLFLAFAGYSAAQDQSMQYYQAGNNFYGQKNYPQAIRYYNAALDINSRFWQVYQALGNTYYVQGDKPKALSNYQRALNLHPDNPQLVSFVQSLRAQMKAGETTEKKKYSDAEVEKILKTASGVADAHFELNPSLGIAFGLGSGLAYGAGVGGFYMFDSNFGIGGMLHNYLTWYSTTYSYPYTTQSNAQGIELEKDDTSGSSLELVAAIKYKFDGNGFRPYLVAGIGLTHLSASETTTYTYQNGPSLYFPNTNSSSFGSQFFPIAVAGI